MRRTVLLQLPQVSVCLSDRLTPLTQMQNVIFHINSGQIFAIINDCEWVCLTHTHTRMYNSLRSLEASVIVHHLNHYSEIFLCFF